MSTFLIELDPLVLQLINQVAERRKQTVQRIMDQYILIGLALLNEDGKMLLGDDVAEAELPIVNPEEHLTEKEDAEDASMSGLGALFG